jgi:hypothetical protein
MEKEMKSSLLRLISVRFAVIIAILVFGIPCLAGGSENWQRKDVDVSLGGSFKIVSVRDRLIPMRSSAAKSLDSSPYAGLPEPPMAGFSPLIVIATSDKRDWTDEYEFQHDLHDRYVGDPLNGPIEQNYIIGIFDTGAMVDLVAGQSAVTLGLEGSVLSPHTFPIGGVGGQVDANLTYPIGIFACGLQAINEQGELDPSYLVGHSNVSVLVAPDISCGTGETITGVVGTPFAAFYTTVIKNDQLQVVNLDGQIVTSPTVEILQPYDSAIPEYPYSISMVQGGLVAVTTANYYPDFSDLETPMFPTLLSMMPGSIPFGAVFFAELWVANGEVSGTNPLQKMRVMVDTGAQSSIMSPGMAANLSLPRDPDFTVDVCGVGGTQNDIPGYRIDYVKINAWGGALEFTEAPFVVLELPSPDGLPLDGVLGMNFFWNRNIVFEPDLVGNSFIHVSEPVSFAYVDFNHNGRVDLADFATMAGAWMTDSEEAAWNPVCDVFMDNSVDFKDLMQLIDQWLLGAE